MSIRKAEEKDLPEIMKIISKEFSYTNFSEESLLQRIKNPNIHVFKKTEHGKTVGFIEIEMREKNGLINGLSIMQGYRNKGFGKKLLGHALKFMEEKGAAKALLLVKHENALAKNLYSSLGFEFRKMHSRKIEDSLVEVWEKHFEQARPGTLEAYLN